MTAMQANPVKNQPNQYVVCRADEITAGAARRVSVAGRDIAILRTMGATRGMIMRVFFLAGA